MKGNATSSGLGVLRDGVDEFGSWGDRTGVNPRDTEGREETTGGSMGLVRQEYGGEGGNHGEFNGAGPAGCV